jgi:UDP-glucose 4-epimerase
MKVMVTGGAGYIGNELVYRLSAEPGIDDILVYDNLCKDNYNLFTGRRPDTTNPRPSTNGRECMVRAE